MKRFRHVIPLVFIVASFIVAAGEQPTAKARAAAAPPTALQWQRLQGTWEGVMVGHEKDGSVTVTITSDALRFQRDADFWFETTITLPAGKDPKQLHATIKGSSPSQASSIGKVVRAFFKIEDGKLTLATIGDDAEETAKGFEAAGTRYELRRAQPRNDDIEPLETK